MNKLNALPLFENLWIPIPYFEESTNGRCIFVTTRLHLKIYSHKYFLFY